MIDLWTWSLELADETRQSLLLELTQAERARAERFVFERDRQHFVAGRGYLRRILADYLGTEASLVAIEVTPRGKPYVVTEGPPLYFNLSHTGASAALGVSRRHEIGVDIERIRPVTEGLAERFFSSGECRALDALPEPQRLPAFFRCWARKEAFVKASGEGLFRALDSFTVDIADAARTPLLNMDGDPAATQRWSFLNFTLPDDVIGSVAVPSTETDLALNRREIE